MLTSVGGAGGREDGSGGSPGGLTCSAARSLQVELPSQQRRLRHLRNIAARNIVNRNGHRLLDTYFTLHLCENSKIYREFYRSEVVRDSLNPTWRSLDFGIIPDRLDTSVSSFMVRIWGGTKEVYRILIEWEVHLDGLKYLGQQIRARNPNEVIFGLNDGYYGASFETKDPGDPQRSNNLQVDQNCVRKSYDVKDLLRLHRTQCAIKQTQVTVQKIGKQIEEKLRLTSASTEMKKESECLQLKILVLRDELERQRRALNREEELLYKERGSLQGKGHAFDAEHTRLQTQKDSLTVLRKECTAKRELFLKTNAQLTIRCRQLLSELSYIYPMDVNDQKDYFICGVKLPNSEDFQAKDDGSIAVALGYTAHLVSMISFFLQVPLRYPIIHKGSRSAIKDNINDKLMEKEREFPLYPKGGEKLQFDYGVFLLNKNIAQLRYQHGLGTPDLRQTLPNLKNFLEHGLMVRCDRHHTSSAIPVPRRPTFTDLDLGFSSPMSTPEKGHRKRASSDSDRLQYKTPPPSYNTAVAEPVAVLASSRESDKRSVSPASSLDVSGEFSKENRRDKDVCGNLNGEHVPLSSDQDSLGHFPQFSNAINGTFLPSKCSGVTSAEQGCDFLHPMSKELCCTVEQAEEITGMDATGEQLEEFNCIPVDHAVAVECDDQVLGEFEECSRRIYALNENMSSFRRPRKSSDK